MPQAVVLSEESSSYTSTKITLFYAQLILGTWVMPVMEQMDDLTRLGCCKIFNGLGTFISRVGLKSNYNLGFAVNLKVW